MKPFSKETYIQRRAELKKRVGEGLMLFLGNGEVGMNYADNAYRFRQDSSFLYYFGGDYAGLAAVIDIENDKEIIFGNELTIDDIVWMGASLGQRGCIAHVVRNCARYGNLSVLEDAYGINILPLAQFALDVYGNDPCVAFGLKGNPELPPAELDLNIKIQKAMAVIQFKVEGQLIDENPDFDLEHRKLLHLIDYEKGTININDTEYDLIDKVMPTIDPADPYRLTDEEEAVMLHLEHSFRTSEKLQRHMRFFLENGALYKIVNGHLLLHACVPLNADGSLKEVNVFGKTYKGRELYDVLDKYVRAGFYSADPAERKRGADLMWWL